MMGLRTSSCLCRIWEFVLFSALRDVACSALSEDNLELRGVFMYIISSSAGEKGWMMMRRGIAPRQQGPKTTPCHPAHTPDLCPSQYLE